MVLPGRLAENYLAFVKQARGYYSNYPITTPLQDYGGEVYNVKAFGAKGDGVTDDIDAINAAIEALPTGGGVVFFPFGIYMISSPIVIKHHGVYLRGIGFSSLYTDQVAQQPGITGLSVIKAMTTFSTTATFIQFGELGTDKMWTNGGLDGLFLINSNATTGHGIDIYNVQHTHVRDCGMSGFTGSIYVNSDQGGGISFTNIEWNLLYNQKGNGIYLGGGSQENYIRFNYLVTSVEYGICAVGTGNTIMGNHVQGVTAGSSGATHKGTGIFNSGSQCFITNNDTLYSGRDGIYISGNQITVTGNTIRNPNKDSNADGSGIWVNGSGTAMLVYANNINDGQSKMQYGVYDNSTTTNGVLIGGNQVTGEQTAKYFSANGAQAANVFLSKVGANVAAPTAYVDTGASTTAAASMRVRSGTAPTSPNDGDIWYDGTDLKMRVGSTTKTFTLS